MQRGLHKVNAMGDTVKTKLASSPLARAYQVDKQKVKEGVRVPLLKLPGGWAKVRRRLSTDYYTLMEKKFTEFAGHLESLKREGREDEAEELDRKLGAEVLAETVVVEIGYVDEKGNEVVLSKAERVAALFDEEFFDLRAELIGHADNFDLFKKFQEADEKN